MTNKEKIQALKEKYETHHKYLLEKQFAIDEKKSIPDGKAFWYLEGLLDRNRFNLEDLGELLK